MYLYVCVFVSVCVCIMYSLCSIQCNFVFFNEVFSFI